MTPALQRSLLAASAGLLGYGGWAFFVNQSAGAEMALRAAIIQGGYSFILTLSMSFFTEKLFAYLARRLPTLHAPWLTVVLVSATTVWIAIGIHSINGTPNIIATILPGFIVGMIYTSAYVAALKVVLRNSQIA